MTRHIILLGHRKQHGKDTCASIIESMFPGEVIRVMFAELLKRQIAERYNLNQEQMESNEYKASTPKHLNGKSVRDVLLQEGRNGREIWPPVWAHFAYKMVIESKQPLGVITDYRFPNEYHDFPIIAESIGVNPKSVKIHRVLVNRPGGAFDNDGADGELPDAAGEWDYVINNDEEIEGCDDVVTSYWVGSNRAVWTKLMWKLRPQVEDMLSCLVGDDVC